MIKIDDDSACLFEVLFSQLADLILKINIIFLLDKNSFVPY